MQHAGLLEEGAQGGEELAEQAVVGHHRAVVGRARQHDAVPATEGQEQAGHEEQGDGPGQGDVAGAGEEGDGGVGLELGIELDDRHGGLVPVVGVEDEALAFHEAEALVAFAEADVFDAARLAAEVDGDFLARRAAPWRARDRSRRRCRRPAPPRLCLSAAWGTGCVRKLPKRAGDVRATTRRLRLARS